MDISEQQVGRVWVVVARGRLDGASSGAFAQRIGALVTGSEPRLVVDFADIEFVSSAGLRAVLTLVKKVKGLKGMLALCAVRAPVREVLDITGFSGMIDIHPERSAALASLELSATKAQDLAPQPSQQARERSGPWRGKLDRRVYKLRSGQLPGERSGIAFFRTDAPPWGS